MHNNLKIFDLGLTGRFLFLNKKIMAITKDKKKEIVEKLKDVTGSDSVVFINFTGLSGNETVEMRSKLNEAGVSYYVAKRTLVKRAFDEVKIEGDFPELSGELAVVYSNDLTGPAREIFAFQKSTEGKVDILGGVFENKYLTKVEMEEIALIPGHDTLKGMFVNVINSPIQGFVMSLKAIAEKEEAKA
jgi:large subunit ribosomal protein L10